MGHSIQRAERVHLNSLLEHDAPHVDEVFDLRVKRNPDTWMMPRIARALIGEFTREVTNLTLFKTSNVTVDRVGTETWFDVLTGPVRYHANTPWSPVAAIGVIALIVSVQLVLPLALYGLSPELYRVISAGQQSGSASLGILLLQQIVAGCLVWFAAGLGNGTRRAVLSLPPLKGRVYTYVTLLCSSTRSCFRSNSCRKICLPSRLEVRRAHASPDLLTLCGCAKAYHSRSTLADPHTSLAISRSLNFSIFPVEVFGILANAT